MTSTSFNVGLSESKNSSRVLKPPGGGHSDIFGIHGENEMVTPHKRQNQPQSTINGCFGQQELTKPVIKDELINTKEIDVKNGNDMTDENTEPIHVDVHKNEEKKNDEPAPTRRGRVPPGGFSNGLW